MLDDNSKSILKDNYLLKKRKDAHDSSIFKGLKNRYFLLGVILGFIVLITLFFVSDYSNVYRITVSGNVYLSDEDIIKLSGISEDTKYFFVFPSLKEKEIKKSSYIDDVTISLLEDRVVNIDVTEKKQVGYMSDTLGSYILLIDGEKINITDSNVYMTSKLPLIEGYSDDQLTEILRGFKNIDYKTINEISEIHRYPFSYDENMMEVIMRDGNYCFVSWTGLELLSKYYSIVSNFDETYDNVCIYLDELTNSGYISICPWQDDSTTSYSESTSQE